MKLSKLSDDYVAQYNLYRAESDRLEARIEKRKKQITRLEAKKQRLMLPSWISLIVEEIAKELIKSMSARCYQILGPFGFGATTSIHFYKDETESLEGCRSITFSPGNIDKGELSRVDHSINTKQFEEGSFGERNGLNHPSIPILPETEIADLAQFVE